MAKHGLKTRLLRFLALRLRTWADEYLVRSIEPNNEAQEPSDVPPKTSRKEGGPPPDFPRRLRKGPPAHWLERVKKVRPDLKVEEGEFLFPLQQATDHEEQQSFDQPPPERRRETLGRRQQPKPIRLQPTGPSNKTQGEMLSQSQPDSSQAVSSPLEQTTNREPSELAADRQAAVDKEEGAVVPKPASQLQSSSQTQHSSKPRGDDREKANQERVGNRGLILNTDLETAEHVAADRITVDVEVRSGQRQVSNTPASTILAIAESNESTYSEQTRSLLSQIATVQEDILNRGAYSRETGIEQGRNVTREQHSQPARTRATIEIRPTPPEQPRVRIVTKSAGPVKTPDHIDAIQDFDNRWPELPENATDPALDELLKAIRETEHLRKLDHEQRGLRWSE